MKAAAGHRGYAHEIQLEYVNVVKYQRQPPRPAVPRCSNVTSTVNFESSLTADVNLNQEKCKHTILLKST